MCAHESLRDVSERAIGTLRVSMTASFAVGYLAPILGEFSRAYPLIKFGLDCAPTVVDLQSDPYDLAIRLGAPPTSPSSLVARKIASLPRYLYASPGYLRQAPALAHPDDLAGHALCGRPASGGQFPARHSLRRGDETVEVHVITDTRHLPARTKLFIAFLKERLAEPLAMPDLPHALP